METKLMLTKISFYLHQKGRGTFNPRKIGSGLKKLQKGPNTKRQTRLQATQKSSQFPQPR